jgi:hypothetical protein
MMSGAILTEMAEITELNGDTAASVGVTERMCVAGNVSG